MMAPQPPPRSSLASVRPTRVHGVGEADEEGPHAGRGPRKCLNPCPQPFLTGLFVAKALSLPVSKVQPPEATGSSCHSTHAHSAEADVATTSNPSPAQRAAPVLLIAPSLCRFSPCPRRWLWPPPTSTRRCWLAEEDDASCVDPRYCT